MDNNYEYVNHPSHYGGKDNVYECIKVIDAWELSFCLGTAIRYICRAGQKPDNSDIQDLEKAIWYLQHEVEIRKRKKTADILCNSGYKQALEALKSIDSEEISRKMEVFGKEAIDKMQECLKENENE